MLQMERLDIDMKILVTGANGYIGSKVVAKLLDDGNTVYASDVNTDHIDTRANIIKINIFNQEELKKIPPIDVCLHLAWRDGFVHNSESHIIDLSHHFEFIKHMINFGVKKISVMGTMHEAGYFEGKMSNLTYTNPLSMYGIAKDCLRRSLQILCKQYNVKFRWLRAFY